MAKKPKRPQPPDDLPQEAVVEWHRAIDALEDAERADGIDMALVELYTRTWLAWRQAALTVAKEGAVMTYEHNGMVGVSPHLRVMKELGRQVRGLLKDLGLTPSGKKVDEPVEEALEF